MARNGLAFILTISIVCVLDPTEAQYLGKLIGKLSELHHGVSGEVYAVDGRTLHIKDYTYDGQGPAAYFYASTYKTADSRGFRLRDENNNGDVIRPYRKEGVTLTLPEGKTLDNIKIFYVWCEDYDVNFGDVKIPRNFDYPRPQKIEALKGVHGISSDNIVIVDAQTLLIPNLHYDGDAPDAKFWVGRGPKPSPQGIRVPDENGKEAPLRRYDGKTVVLTLPGDLTVFDIGHFGIWCEEFTVDFGHIQLPQGVNVPPSLKMLGVSPQSKLNCEVLDDGLAFEVRWAVAGDSIVLQLVAKLEDREYMSFGLSGDDAKSTMVGGDVVVAWVDQKTLKGYAQDYYLGDKSQCSGPTGSCPDVNIKENTDNIRLLNAAVVNGYSIVTYQRSLKAADEFDRPIYTNQSQAIIWAVGPLNQRDEVSFHTHYLKRNSLINFGRPAKWNCPLPEGDAPGHQTAPVRKETTVQPEYVKAPQKEEEEQQQDEPSSTVASRREGGGHRRRVTNRVVTRQPAIDPDTTEEGQASRREATRTRGTPTRGPATTTTNSNGVSKRNAWFIPPIECYEPEDGVLYAQMGPTGGKRGYPAITGHVGWGISWYINGLLIPEINVVRGKTYSFVTEGGNDPEIPAKYHPFYITDDPIGGYVYKTPDERKNVTIFAGVSYDKDGEPQPTGVGRLCHWTQMGDKVADDFESFGAYQRTLMLKCDMGDPGLIQWTPDKNTPDTVYYQCFTHRHLGWKINVHDTCQEPSASEVKYSIVEAPDQRDTMVIPNELLNGDIGEASNQSQRKISENKSPTLDQTILTTPSSPPPPPPPPISGHNSDTSLSNQSRVVRQSLQPPLNITSHLVYYVQPQPKKPLNKPPTSNNNDKLQKTPHIKAGVARGITTNNLKHVEISRPQASTEKEVEIQTVATPWEARENFSRGFDPKTIVLETGFKPIVMRQRSIHLDVDPEGETGVVEIDAEPKFEAANTKRKKVTRRSLTDLDVELEAAASGLKTSYLPPPGHSEKPKELEGKLPSQIDFETPRLPTKASAAPSGGDSELAASPPDVVVTFDGKRVSGASLTAKPFDREVVLQRGSKAAEYLRALPQSVPFRGDLPPLDANVLFKNKNHEGSGSQYKALSRDLDTPLPPSQPTKLRRVRKEIRHT